MSNNSSLTYTANTGETKNITGVISNNNGSANNIDKQGIGNLTLQNNNTYTGATTITAGTLQAAANGALGSGTTGTSSIAVKNGGTLLLSNATATDRVRNDAPITLGSTTGLGTASITRVQGGSEGSGAVAGLGSLTLAANSSLNYGGSSVANGTLTFGGATAFAPSGFTLSILGYEGVFGTATPGLDGTNDRLIFASNQSGNLSQFSFVNPDGLTGTFGAGQIDLGNGFFEITPVPEPSTWVAGSLALLAVGFTQRRRLAGLLQIA